MANDAGTDTGPVLHLHEIGELSQMLVFTIIFLTPPIEEELKKYLVEKLPKQFRIEPFNKDHAARLMERFGIQLGEASVISFCQSEGVRLVLTDDLDARDVAQQLGLRPVGTVGIIMRALREKIIDENKALETLKRIQFHSSLFITSKIINYAGDEIKKYKGS